MKNYLFTPKHLAILKDHAHWHLIATGLPEKIAAGKSPKYDRWASQHEEVHSFREIIIVLGGECYQRLCGKTYRMSEGAAMLFDVGESHCSEYPRNQFSGEYLSFHFFPDLVCANLLRVRANRRAEFREHIWHRSYPLPSLGIASSKILFPEKNPKAPIEVIRRRCLVGLEMLVCSVIEKGYHAQTTSPQEYFQANVIHAMAEHIQETYGRDCSLENLARLAGYSTCYFSRLFGKHAGMSLPECVNAARITGFQRMLAEGKALKAIAFELGFSHPSALSRWRRQQGV